MSFFNSVLNMSVFLLGIALLSLSLYAKYNNQLACLLKTEPTAPDNTKLAELEKKQATANICLDIILFMGVGMILLPLGCYMCAGEDHYGYSGPANEFEFGKLGTLPLALAGLMGLVVVTCGSILFNYTTSLCPASSDGSTTDLDSSKAALQWIIGLGAGMFVTGSGAAYIHHHQLLPTGPNKTETKTGEKEGEGEGAVELTTMKGNLLPGGSGFTRSSRFSRRGRSP